MRVLIFHGYLLRGTGSNVYNAELGAALVRAGHEVHLVCQERDPFALPWVDARADWDEGALAVEARREVVRATVYRPDIGGLLPVYVADRYDGVVARPFPALSDEELDRYLAANVAAVREVAARARPDVALANHLVMGPAVLARALDAAVGYAVKIHGSALEYTVKPHPRFRPYAVAGLARASGILVGSRHTAESLWAELSDPSVSERTRLGPPGVDVERFAPQSPAAASATLASLRARLAASAPSPPAQPALAAAPPAPAPPVPAASPPAPAPPTPALPAPAPPADAAPSSFARDVGEAVAALDTIAPGDRLVVFVGKLIASKGVELLLAAFPLVLAREPRARLLIVGFGAFRGGLEVLAQHLAAGDLDAAARTRAEDGRELPELAAFFARLDGARRDAYRAAAARLPERVAWAGRLEHDEVADLLPAAEAMAVTSTFPEAFGMVAAEAAACGALPVVADHSGLGEVARTLAAVVPPPARPWLTFEVGPDAVAQLADALSGWLQAPADLRAQTRAAIVEETRARYSWDGVARTVIAAAGGELGDLPRPA
ncbi:MAG TPA: glycosyltransferase [Solirubrobacter sp.]|nr:glycosyltransferase [Solirubrobacter sp.]